MFGWLKKLLGKHRGHESPAEDSGDALPEYVVVEDVLDLHGFFPEQVPEMVREFIWHAEQQGYSEVRIIHGKGKSRLKWMVRKELERLGSVITFSDAPPALGGWGATIVRVRTKKGEGKR